MHIINILKITYVSQNCFLFTVEIIIVVYFYQKLKLLSELNTYLRKPFGEETVTVYFN